MMRALLRLPPRSGHPPSPATTTGTDLIVKTHNGSPFLPDSPCFPLFVLLPTPSMGAHLPARSSDRQIGDRLVDFGISLEFAGINSSAQFFLKFSGDPIS